MPDREKVIKGLECCCAMNGDDCRKCPYSGECLAGEATYQTGTAHLAADALTLLKGQEPDASKYQYKYDHTDCIWYHDSRSKCPVTCSQYRDGWNDAMDFIFKNGVGYRPYNRR